MSKKTGLSLATLRLVKANETAVKEHRRKLEQTLSEESDAKQKEQLTGLAQAVK